MADHGLHTLSPARGATSSRKRVGRGPGSGNGKRAARGQKGQNARSGGGVRPGFEGGQMPLQKRMPKLRGSHKMSMPVGPFRTRTQSVNVRRLNRFEDGATVDRQALKDAGMIKNFVDPVKVIGNEGLETKLTVIADGFSAGARDIITKAGGEAKDA